MYFTVIPHRCILSMYCSIAGIWKYPQCVFISVCHFFKGPARNSLPQLFWTCVYTSICVSLFLYIHYIYIYGTPIVDLSLRLADTHLKDLLFGQAIVLKAPFISPEAKTSPSWSPKHAQRTNQGSNRNVSIKRLAFQWHGSVMLFLLAVCYIGAPHKRLNWKHIILNTRLRYDV